MTRPLTEVSTPDGDSQPGSPEAAEPRHASPRSRRQSDQRILALLKRFCAGLRADDRRLILSGEVRDRLAAFLAQQPALEADLAKALRRLFRGCVEVLLDGEATYAVLRPDVGRKDLVRIHPESERLERVDRRHYLEVKDSLVQGPSEAAKAGLEIDFSPFFREFPQVTEATEMGEGISVLNRHLSALMYKSPDVFRGALLNYLKEKELDGHTILANDHLATPALLLEELAAVRAILRDYPPDEPYSNLAHELRTHGFEAGWGRTAEAIAQNLALLSQVMESSDPGRFERLLGQLPLVRSLVMVSPHGWFAQEGVLGRPDTGGQVTYVLDQARALERQMREQFEGLGIDVSPRIVILTRLIPDAEGTSCGVRREQIHGTRDSWILRVPFRDERGEVVPDWISRFRIWPYLEGFAEEAKAALLTELRGEPDLIIGHYTDGNLVAHRLAEELGCTHCACVHALEKTKYLFSDLHWADMEQDYHFSLQFTADLIAYNSSDFILSSSYREVGGTATEMGMLESYDLFSLPGLYRVVSGLDPRLARHNIVPPGASEEYFFPAEETARRSPEVRAYLEQRFFAAAPAAGDVGRLSHPERPSIFAMARMDRIKNLPGLVEIYGRSPQVREQANLLLVSSLVTPEDSEDQEEIAEVRRVYEIIAKYGLDGNIRWCAARLDKIQTGEIYRLVADRQGVFAQPAFMETFGLTVIEAMACGLPVVVTCYGGPAEIVRHDQSGLIADPNDHSAFAAELQRVVQDPSVWNQLSEGGIRRVREAFTWSRHAQRVLKMANVHSYWNYIDVMNRQALDQYIHTLYHTVYRPRTQALLLEG